MIGRKGVQLTEHFELDETVANEELLQYASGSPERQELESALLAVLNRVKHVPIVINGQEFSGDQELQQVPPFDLCRPIARYSYAHRVLIQTAMEKSVEAQEGWDKTKLSDRIKIWERAAELISDRYRFKIIAATMIGQGKTLRQAEMDVAELVDFMRFTPVFLRDLANYEPINNCPDSCKNTMRLRGLTG